MSDERPESLLKSALEKIVYFEARSTQLSNDLELTRAEVERLKGELGHAAQREIELRRVIAELEVRATRAHAEREETARLAEALRRERADLVGKMLDASRIHGSDQGPQDFDLAQFIATLRSEVLLTRSGPVMASVPATDESSSQPDALPTSVTAAAHELSAQGRLAVTAKDLETLSGAQAFPGRSEETLFGFSVRELSAPDAPARARAAERLKALGHPAAAPALATALHAESEPSVQVALLSAFSSMAKAEGVAVVQPLLTSRAPDVRIAALKALLTLDAAQAGPHLAAAMSDPDKAVRRRASLLALGLKGAEALELGTQAIHDADADVRALAALVLGASQADAARPMLLDAMRDQDLRVRRSASQALSRLLGRDVTNLVGLDDAQRRREVRRLAHVPAAKVDAKAHRAATQRAVVSAHVDASKSARAGLASQQVAGVMTRAVVAPRADAVVAPRGMPAAVASDAGVVPRGAAASHVASPVAVASDSGVAPRGAVASHLASPEAVASSPATHVAMTSRAASTVAQSALALDAPVSPVRSAVATAASPARARTAVAVLEVDDAPPAPPAALSDGIVRELRAAIRGKPLSELASTLGASMDDTMRACSALLQQGQVVRRGLKYFVA